MTTDLDIARAATPRPITEIAQKLGIPEDALVRYGEDKAKVSLDWIRAQPEKTGGKLILVTAITPTPAGEGKTTTTVGLGDALARIGKNTAICLREPSLGPCFGMKGGAAGGGHAQVIPMEDINLHFTGDFHAIAAANNLLAAMIDNAVNWRKDLELDNRRISWRRTVDMNDRSLRDIVTSLGGVGNGAPRQGGFDITAASEVMAILCLATDLQDLQRRLGNIIVGQDMKKRGFVRAHEIKAEGAMAALLKDALKPNLVQTLEGTPAFVHGGPFANIAHGCNSLMATQTAKKCADYVVTEAGFGADLGAEKFFDIKCRKGGLKPDAVVLVATLRALKMQGGASRAECAKPDAEALTRGFDNLARHVENLRHFGVPAVVAINRFPADLDDEVELVRQHCAELEVGAISCTHHAHGGAGAEDLARAVVALAESGASEFRMLYPDDMSLWDKTRTVARMMYGAQGVIADKKIRAKFQQFQDSGFGHLPVCVAKTQYSFSTDPDLKGAPSNHVVPVRDVRLSAGAEFVVVICGDIMTMPGLPQHPAAENIRVNDKGEIEGLF
ncbi:MAG: formate--tetrahydrofolate ligase [Alphaproteobacteria bacterium]|nr:formate--tetrahydrofolate ligase [Alphaproteobacteria bacterium]MBF0251543.1 formate--tetrahydrofolate ligase [Alphaproteobacteria bacterium]